MSRYGTLIDSQLHPAPRAFMLHGAMVTNPKAEHFAALNVEREKQGLPPYLLVVDEPPSESPTEGWHYEARGWEYATERGAMSSIIEREYVLVRDTAPTLSDFDAAMEAQLYEERAARGYTTREPDAYLNSSVPRWAQDARDWVAHRDAVMAYALALINAVDDGDREPPTMAEFRAGLPVISWTYTEVN